MKIGIFSGSFDPIHTGHAMIANYASQWAGLDRVWLMPSRVNPWKTGAPPAPDAVRLEMCRLVADECPKVEASDFEFGLPLPSYTYYTLRRLKEKYPEHEFSLIIGSDNWVNFNKWKNWVEILAGFRIIVYPRPGYEVDKASLPESVTLLEDAPLALISSTFLRNAFKDGMDLSFFIPGAVLKYINTHKIYD